MESLVKFVFCKFQVVLTALKVGAIRNRNHFVNPESLHRQRYKSFCPSHLTPNNSLIFTLKAPNHIPKLFSFQFSNLALSRTLTNWHIYYPQITLDQWIASLRFVSFLWASLILLFFFFPRQDCGRFNQENCKTCNSRAEKGDVTAELILGGK